MKAIEQYFHAVTPSLVLNVGLPHQFQIRSYGPVTYIYVPITTVGVTEFCFNFFSEAGLINVKSPPE